MDTSVGCVVLPDNPNLISAYLNWLEKNVCSVPCLQGLARAKLHKGPESSEASVGNALRI